MKALPVSVSESEISEVMRWSPLAQTLLSQMFCLADKDQDGRLSYREFQLMVNPPDLAQVMRRGEIEENVYCPDTINKLEETFRESGSSKGKSEEGRFSFLCLVAVLSSLRVLHQVPENVGNVDVGQFSSVSL